MASSLGFAEIVQLLIEHGADVTAQNETHLTPLYLVSSLVRATTSSLLVHARTDTGRQDDRGYERPMSIAKAETMRLLIKHGADVTTHDDAYSTPLHLASSQGSTETVQILLEHGADVSAQDERHRTPLHLVSSWVSRTAASLVI